MKTSQPTRNEGEHRDFTFSSCLVRANTARAQSSILTLQYTLDPFTCIFISLILV